MAAPIFSGLDNNPTFTENSSAVLLDTSASVSDADVNQSVDGATLTLARIGGGSEQDILSGNFDEGQVISQRSGLVVGFAVLSAGTLTVTFNSDAVLDDVNDVLQQLTYANSSDTPPSSVVVGYTFDNGDVATGSITVSINQINDAPSIDTVNPSAFFQPGSSGVVLSPAVTLSDFDSATLNRATVSFLGSFLGSDTLSVNVGSTGIAASYAGGVLTLSGNATIEQYRQVLQTVTYTSSAADPTNGGADPSRDLRWEIRDSANGLSTAADTHLDFSPSVDLDASAAGIDFATTFAAGGAAVAIADSDANITITSLQSISSISVVLTNAKAGDTLSATGGPLDVTVDNSQPGRVTLIISGVGNEAQYESALKSVTFGSASTNIDPTARNLTVVVSDDNSQSLTAHSIVTITGAVNDPGSAADDSAIATTNTVLTVAAPGVLGNDNDPDGLVVITGAVATSHGGSIQFASDGSYTYTPAANFHGTDTVSYTAQDPFGSQVSATLHITVNAVAAPFQYAASGDLGSHGGSYQIAGVADFNGDGTADVLWRDPASGKLDEWQLQNGNWSKSIDLGSHGAGWTVAATGDFNGDGASDILFRETATGKLDAWIMKNGQWSKSIDLGSHGTDWKVIGAGDFDGDHDSDILFQNTTTGATDQWVMSGGNWSGSKSLGSHSTAYSSAAIGDFDGDGTSDVLWYNPANGAVEQWHMQAGNWSGTIDLGSYNAAYQLAAVNDFNGDGTSDVLWRNPSSGQVEGWVMDHGQWKSSVSLGSFNTAWTLAGTGDFNHAGGADVLWHNAATGQVGTWLLGAA